VRVKSILHISLVCPAYLLSALFLNLELCPTLLAHATASPASVAYVLDMAGAWRVSGATQNLTIGNRLPAGALLVNDNAAKRDFIIVANLNGEVIRTIRCQPAACRECQTGGGCYDPIQPLPDAPGSDNAFNAAWRAIEELFASHPDHFSVHRVRDDGFVLSRDAVVPLNGNSIDLTALLHDQAPGAFQLRCSNLSGDDKAATAAWKSKPVNLQWAPGGTASAEFEGLRPGLFSLSVKHEGETSNAWILVVPSTGFSGWNARFEEFTLKTDAWGSLVSAERKRSYQRAYLDYLNSQLAGQPQ
jgi:hypothetical protein